MNKRELQPVASIEWIDRESVQPNDYNPNHQPTPEYRLLKTSILEDGWTQPIVVFDDGSGDKPVIVDGEHRWKISKDKDVAKLTGGMIPIVRIQKTRGERIASTVRHNRARGEHGIKEMSSLVRELLESGFSVDRICELMGMEDEEVYRLAERAGMPAIVSKSQPDFNKGWTPE